MAHKHVFEVVNCMLQHVMGDVDPALNDMFFGGKVVVMGSDFRQILLVVPRGRRGQIMDASLKRSAVL
jgi:ATP-dependent DNA helicase PIF1